MLNRSRVLLATAVSTLASCSLAACGTEASEEPDATTTPSPSVTAVEATTAQPRLAVSYDGGVLVLDAATGDVLLDHESEGFLRLSPAGDGRHVMVSGPGGFTALDLGSWTDEHGDHGHSWTTDPRLTDFTVAAEEPGHVVAHGGRTTLFDDGTGIVTAFDDAELEHLDEHAPELDTWELPEAHHGVAVQDELGNLIHTVGDEESRSGIRVATASGNELAVTDECPGVHGEAYAGDVAVFGCEDGVVVVDGRTISKVTSPDAYGRIGNQAGHETSPFVLGDYKVDPDAELERPTRVTVIDTRDASLRLVDLPASYTFRSLDRMPDGDGLVLGTDGSLHVVDVETARVSRSLPVTAAWREPMDWQVARPLVEVVGELAYVTEPATSQVHVVDLGTFKVVDTLELPQVPMELSAVTG
ncbi:zinc metallochaperone AztD [Nocardioides caeni]|uniref:Uncharacterized protein n=1 Tax=Nocardioides caeni TaxID=574700 RepID=A0A4S8N8N9_9ACTN|nr:zinc metallochaperone AztD [Nocardioides caeni]THV12112.1 hypothetical protein E9934_12220 [Nocardioides caeni]